MNETAIAYFDVFVGASGDMLLGSLVDAGLPLAVLEQTIAALGLTDQVQITARPAQKGGLTGTKVEVEQITREVSHRSLSDILRMIEQAALPPTVQEKAAAVFQNLGTAEARVHGIPLDEVHFHEVGAVDAIVDVVGTVAGLHALGVTRVLSSPIPLARGYANTAHGKIPAPGPATVALLAGVPIYGLDFTAENVTPTGAALLATLADAFGPLPAMTLQRIGYGAGTIDLPLPNMVRLLLGTHSEGPAGLIQETLTLLHTNIDDMPGEWFGPLFEDLLAAGALDVWLTPIQMKKNRPASMLSVLAAPSDVPALRLYLLRDTTTLGLREETITRWRLHRETREIQTPWGSVSVKVASLPDGGRKISPEFEDCRRLAREQGVPLREVYLAAWTAAHEI